MTRARPADTRRWRSSGGAVAVGYLLGLVPSASVAARLASGGRIDLRQRGSGNPGAANAIAVLGSRWGYGVMAADVAKSTVACRLGRRLAGDRGQHLAGFASVVGHCYPVTHRFRGGKGVACSAGQCLATFPAFFPVDLAVAAAVSAGPWRQRAFAATVVSSAAWVAAGALWWRRGWANGWGGSPTAGLPVAAAATSAVMLQRFHAGRRP